MSSDDGSIGHISIHNTQLKHADGVYDTIRLGYGVPLSEDSDDCSPKHVLTKQLDRFPEGQFVAVCEQDGIAQVVGVAITMRTSRPPSDQTLTWAEQVGDLSLPQHEPDGKWLYGVDMVVRPNFRRRGVGTALYNARFELVKRLNLRGWYAGGMLMGYNQYAAVMDVETYANKVRRRELKDPTVTMQMNRGFKAVSLIKEYYPMPDAHSAAMFIVWHNPLYKPAHGKTLRGESVIQRT
ncbi:MAG: GNAT family N-acetyltransferase [Deinococcota bacterium]